MSAIQNASARLTAGVEEPACARAARRYLSYGWSVVPLCRRSKKPLVRWERWQTVRPSEAEVEGWFRRWPQANVGIVTGTVSNLVVLDVDPRHGGEDALARLEGQSGPLPVTIEAMTGGGGRHLYFAHPGEVARGRVGLAEGIDLRAEGGYVVAPPSVHPNGKPYGWIPGRSPGDTSPAPFPRRLLTLSQAGYPRRTLDEWRRLARDGVPEGWRNSTIASLTGHLLRHDVDDLVALELMLAWNRARCRPPLDDTEVAGVVESIARIHRREDARPLS